MSKNDHYDHTNRFVPTWTKKFHSFKRMQRPKKFTAHSRSTKTLNRQTMSGENNNLFVSIDSANKGTALHALKMLYAIDGSGSTGGTVMRHQQMSAHMLCKVLPICRIVGWGTTATLQPSLRSVGSTYGGTSPESVIPYLKDQPNQCLILYTDGQIYNISRFCEAMQTVEALPIIIVLTVSSSYTMASRIADIETQVNMSIPEAMLATSNDVLIAVNVGGEHKVLMAKGAFDVFGSLPQLETQTRLETLVDFDMNRLAANKNVHFQKLSPGLVRLRSFEQPLDLEALYVAQDIPVDVLRALADRTLFPQYDVTRLHATLTRISRKLNENPEIARLAAQLAEIAVDKELSGGEQHRELLAQYQAARENKSGQRQGSVREKRTAIERLFNMLNDYAADRSSIVLGSNRANRAVAIAAEAFDESALGDCIALPECPIFLTEDAPACVLLRYPSIVTTNGEPEKGGKNVDDAAQDDDESHSDEDNVLSVAETLKYCTSDYAMEAPFAFGKTLARCVTRGLYSLEFARDAKRNPFSRQSVAGYVPLSKDPNVVMRHMARVFGGSRELWHFVRAYIGMMVEHCATCEWAERALIHQHLQALLDNYVCNHHLKGQTDDRRPLRACFSYVVHNYAECLRDRYPEDSITILEIVDTLMPSQKYDRKSIMGMVSVVATFSKLLRKHKKNLHEDAMMLEVIEVDECGHFVRERTTVRSLIARIFWYDQVMAETPIYRGVKLQYAIDKALNDRRFGDLLRTVFAGESLDVADERLRIALPEPTGTHAQQEKFGHWTKDGRATDCCVYCGETFNDPLDLYAHLKKEFGPYFFNGQRAVQCAIQELGITASDTDLFKRTKQIVFKRHGIFNGALHTQFTKQRLFMFIQKFKEVLAARPN